VVYFTVSVKHPITVQYFHTVTSNYEKCIAWTITSSISLTSAQFSETSVSPAYINILRKTHTKYIKWCTWIKSFNQ